MTTPGATSRPLGRRILLAEEDCLAITRAENRTLGRRERIIGGRREGKSGQKIETSKTIVLGIRGLFCGTRRARSSAFDVVER